MLPLKMRNLISVVVLAIIFYVFYKMNMDWGVLASGFKQYDLFWLFPALVIYLIGYYIRGWRWVVLLAPVKQCRFNSLYPTLLIGFMMNNILPARLGEFIRAYLNGKKEGISTSASLATIILERLFDGLTMVLMLGVAIKFGHLPMDPTTMDPRIQTAIRLSPYVFGAAFGCLFLMILFRNATERLALATIRLTPRKVQPLLEKLASTFLQGLHILKSPKESLLVLTASIAAWTCEFTCFYLVAIGYHLSPAPITFFTAALVMAIVNLAILIPNAPGGFGLFEFAGVALLVPLGILKESALGYMILIHLVVWIPITLWGFWHFYREGLSLSQLEKEQQASK
jgi:uncharacterized protein (TIRG00374 family)